MRSRIAAGLVLALALAGCSLGGGDDGLESAVNRLTMLLETHDVKSTTLTFTEPEAVEAANDLLAPLKSSSTEVTASDIARDGDRGSATLHWKVSVQGHPWEHTTRVELQRVDDQWRVRWEPAIVESSLKAGESLRVTRMRAARGDILSESGKPIVTSRPVLRVGIDKTKVSGAKAVRAVRLLARVVGVDAGDLATQVKAAGDKAFVQAIVFRRADVAQSLMRRITAIPGVIVVSDHLPLAPTREFAAPLLGTVGPATAEIVEESDGRVQAGDDTGLSGLQRRYDEELSGRPGVKVSAVPVVEEASDLTEDKEPRTLFSVSAVDGEPLKLSLGLRLQALAEDAVADHTKGPAGYVPPPTALVAIRPSTGAIVAAASGPGAKGQNIATYGRFAPGSTFKVVSSLALLRAGLTPDSMVTCPPQVVVDGKRFGNYSDYPANRLGRITLRQAVAYSCNTAFIGQRGKVKGTALADAAAALGFGTDYDVGFPAYFGEVPEPASETEAAADLIGQGRITASPMAMAAVAASVASAHTVIPWLVEGHTAEPSHLKPPLTKPESNQLREMMQAVVDEGSGSALRSLQPPELFAKTGTAEYGDAAPPKTHAWMIAAQGDLAVAVFVGTGESGSRTAGPILADFLRAAR